MPPSAGRRVWICWKLQLQLLRTAWTQWAGDGCYGDLWDLGSNMFQTLKLSRVVVSEFFYFHPEPWGRIPFWRAYFSAGLVQPPTSYLRNHFLGLIFDAPKFEAVEVYTHVSQKNINGLIPPAIHLSWRSKRRYLGLQDISKRCLRGNSLGKHGHISSQLHQQLLAKI